MASDTHPRRGARTHGESSPSWRSLRSGGNRRGRN